MAFGAAPGKHHLNHRESSGAQGESGRIAVPKVAEIQIAASDGDTTLVRHKFHAEGTPDGVLKGLLEKEKVGCAITVILIAGQSEAAIDVLAAQSRLEIERNFGHRIHGFRNHESQSDRAIQIARA